MGRAIFFLRQFLRGKIAVLFVSLLAFWFDVREPFRSPKRCELNLLFFGDVSLRDLKTYSLIECHRFGVVSTHIERQMCWVISKKAFDEFATNPLPLAECLDCDAHQVAPLRRLWLLDSCASLLDYLLLHDFLGRVLYEECSVADNGLSVSLASNDDFVNRRHPKRLNNHARVFTVAKCFSVNLA